tara:strand:- start:49 stop:243 length:195 start_codon:yes stop_codon:yes gene_type:complete
MKKKSSEWVKYSGLGIQMAVSVVLCLYIGKWVGGKYNNEMIGSLIGIFFGLFASTYNLIKEIKN